MRIFSLLSRYWSLIRWTRWACKIGNTCRSDFYSFLESNGKLISRYSSSSQTWIAFLKRPEIRISRESSPGTSMDSTCCLGQKQFQIVDLELQCSLSTADYHAVSIRWSGVQAYFQWRSEECSGKEKSRNFLQSSSSAGRRIAGAFPLFESGTITGLTATGSHSLALNATTTKKKQTNDFSTLVLRSAWSFQSALVGD